MQSSPFNNCFGDRRLDKRGTQLRQRLFSNGTRSILALSSNRAEQKAFYRFLANDKTAEQTLIAEMTDRCAAQVSGRIVLCIQDSTEINLSSHTGRLQAKHIDGHQGDGLGDINDSTGTGFFLHPSLVVDAATAFPIGFSSILLWNRAHHMPNKKERNYASLPPDARESYKWTKSSEQSREVLDSARAIVIVQDREGDIFAQFARITDPKTFLLVRSRFDRKTADAGRLWERLSASPCLGSYTLAVSPEAGAAGRDAHMEVRCVSAVVQSPPGEQPWLPESEDAMQLYAIEAREIGPPNVLGIENPLCWRLITNWPVAGLEDALLLIEWYSWRWMIEELFRMLKKEGYHIEGSELENGWSVRKLTCLILDVIVKLMQMHIAYNDPEGDNPSAGLVFSEGEQQCLASLSRKLEGQTEKLRNGQNVGTLRWATWAIARLGGWKGYSSQRLPGMTTLLRGLIKFSDFFDGWTLARDVGTR